MPEETLSQVTSLLEEAANLHECIRSVILSTTEGVIVAAITKDKRSEPHVVATVSAALVWASQSAVHQVGGLRPTHLIHDTHLERIAIIIQPHYQLVVTISKSGEQGFSLQEHLPTFESLATRVEMIIGSSKVLKHEELLSKIIEALPEIREAMLITYDGLPLSSVGFKNHIEIAGLAGSIFANGLTYSSLTNSMTIKSDRLNLLVVKVDDNRLLVTVCRGDQADELAAQVEEVLHDVIG